MPVTTTERPETAAPAPSPEAAAATPKTSRDPWFDNAKFVLVVLVVVGHSLVILPKNTTTDWLYDFLYAWHVPAFVLVTGYLSRSFDYSTKRLVSLVRTVVVPYLVFEALLAVFRTQVGGETLHNIWRDPHWPMWYLSALFFWRVMTPVFKRMPMPVAVPIAVAISISAGWWAGSTLDLARVFGLLPFFVLGLTLKREHLQLLKGRWVPYAALGVLATILVAARFTDRWISTEWLYYRTEYTDLGLTGPDANVTRLVVLGVGLLGALSILALIPNTTTWFTKLGSASLVVYLFHGFFIKTAEYVGVPDWADAHPALSLALIPVLAVLLGTFLSLPAIASRLNKVVDPFTTIGDVLHGRAVRPDDITLSGEVRASNPMSLAGR